MDAIFCAAAFEEALLTQVPSGAFSSEQGSQVTNEDFTRVPKAREICVSAWNARSEH